MDTIQFGSFIAKRRKELKLTQKELAEKLSVTDKAVSRWENGHGFPDIESLEPLARELEVSLLELLHGEMLLIPELKNEGAADGKKGAVEIVADAAKDSVRKEAADDAIENALEITLENRRRERKRTILLFAGSMLLMLLFSILKSVPFIGMIAMAFAAIYGFAGAGLVLRGKRGKSVLDGTVVFYGILLLAVALGILFLMLGTSINFQ